MVRPDAVLAVSPTVSVLPLGDELTLYDAASGQTLALNRTAADVLSLLDGNTSIKELEHLLARVYALPLSEAVEAVEAVVDRLLGSGTVRVSDVPAVGPSEPS